MKNTIVATLFASLLVGGVALASSHNKTAHKSPCSNAKYKTKEACEKNKGTWTPAEGHSASEDTTHADSEG